MSKIDFGEVEPDPVLSDVVFRHFVEQSGDVTLLVNSRGQLQYVSPSVGRVLGYASIPSSLITLLSWIHFVDRPRLLALLQSPLEESQVLQCRFRHHHGHWVTCHLLIQNFTGFVSQDEGVADVRWYLLNVRSMPGLIDTPPGSKFLIAEDEKETNLNFLGIMSHELRTPINAMNGFAQLLLRQTRSPLSLEQQDMVQRIYANGQNLLRLINNILDLSKLEAGQMRLQLEQVNISDLIEGTIQDLSSLTTQKKLSIHTDIRLLNPVILNDPMRLRQILVNLLANAINVSQNGDVWVVVAPCEPVSVKITVQDTGPGIAPEDLDRVFNEFWQWEPSSARLQLGTGLGLTICHNLVKMMRGDIQVHSHLGKGATFQVVIPQKISM